MSTQINKQTTYILKQINEELNQMNKLYMIYEVYVYTYIMEWGVAYVFNYIYMISNTVYCACCTRENQLQWFQVWPGISPP